MAKSQYSITVYVDRGNATSDRWSEFPQTGHTFVTVTDPNGSITRGYYANGGSFWDLERPGMVKDDAGRIPQAEFSFEIPLTQSQYNTAMGYINNKTDNPGTYTFYDNNCTGFVYNLLVSLGLLPKIPDLNPIPESIMLSALFAKYITVPLLGLFRPNPGSVAVDPLVLDLNGDGVALTNSLSSTAFFDMDGDGIREKTGWVSGGDGFLVRDINNNGNIDIYKYLSANKYSRVIYLQ